MSAESRIQELGLTLPEVPAPVASYVNCVRSGNLLFLSGGLPVENGELITGKVPDSISVDKAIAAARNIILNRLSLVRQEIGSLNKVRRIVNLQGFVNSTPDFYDHPKIINGASDLLLEVFGDAGKHSRIALGAAALPLNAAVEISLVVEVE
jgi:enamine deaminase RidA (YjgF/YER057c/UK114 family)